jgi:FixJ family two-component response regulator
MTYPPEDCLVHVVDDDAGLRRSLRFLLDTVRSGVRQYASAEQNLDLAAAPTQPSCLLLDIRMPAMSGLELQQVLRERGVQLPILFMTGHADVSMAVQAMKSGASDFIEKPLKHQMLLHTVAEPIRRSAQALEEAQRRDAALAVLAALSPREKEAARLIARGLPNKLIAASLGISEKTVHIHRQHIMEKAAISSAAELARLMLRADPAALD